MAPHLNRLGETVLMIGSNICFKGVTCKIKFIGVGRFRILGGQGLEFGGGGQGGPNSQQAHDVVTTSMRRNDVTSSSF